MAALAMFFASPSQSADDIGIFETIRESSISFAATAEVIEAALRDSTLQLHASHDVESLSAASITSAVAEKEIEDSRIVSKMPMSSALCDGDAKNIASAAIAAAAVLLMMIYSNLKQIRNLQLELLHLEVDRLGRVEFIHTTDRI